MRARSLALSLCFSSAPACGLIYSFDEFRFPRDGAQGEPAEPSDLTVTVDTSRDLLVEDSPQDNSPPEPPSDEASLDLEAPRDLDPPDVSPPSDVLLFDVAPASDVVLPPADAVMDNPRSELVSTDALTDAPTDVPRDLPRDFGTDGPAPLDASGELITDVLTELPRAETPTRDTVSLECSIGQSRCGDVCVSTPSDSNHCGACDRRCPPLGLCSLGRCCGHEGGPCCGGTCGVDLVCSNNVCARCPSGFAVCSGQCRSLAYNASHCGACGRVCGGALCRGGICILATGCPQSVGQRCTDTPGMCCVAGDECAGGSISAPTCCHGVGRACTAAPGACCGTLVCHRSGRCCYNAGDRCVASGDCCIGGCVGHVCVTP